LSKRLIVIIIIAFVLISALAGMFMIPKRSIGNTQSPENVIGVIKIEGTIMGGSGSIGIFGSQPGADSIIKQLREAEKDDNVEAVVLRINSPGGAAAASREIRDQVVKLGRSGKKVVASMGDVAASGGYMVACAADKILANPSTTTGSIGVIMQLQNTEELYDKLGIRTITIKSGPHKDMGSPDRPLTEEEREILQSMIDDMYDQFVSVVAEGRNMTKEEVRQVADGRVFTGRQALELGLVDQLGDFYDAVEVAKEMAGIDGEVTLKEYGKQSMWEQLLPRIVAPFGKVWFRVEDLLRIKLKVS
jgi:protease-4